MEDNSLNNQKRIDPNTSDINSQTPPVNSSSGMDIIISFKVIIGIAILLILSGAAFYFFNLKNSKNQKMVTSTMAKGFPVVHEKNGNIFIYNITTGKITQEPIKGVSTSKYGGSSGLGSTEVFPSPDMTMSAIIDSTTHDLFLITHETGTAERITDKENVQYITGWTKDSKHLLYYIGGYDPASGEMPDDQDRGFYLLNIESGVSKKLEGIQAVEALSNDKILINNGGKFSLYDIYTGASDSSPFLPTYGTGFFNQIDLSPDAMHWTFTHGKTEAEGNPAGSAEIYYAEIGKDSGQLIAQGSFAEVQFPLISPDDNRILYRQGSGGNLNSAVIIDLPTNTEIARVPSGKAIWIDNDKILRIEYQDQAEFHKYSIWDLGKKASTDDINSKLPKSAYEIVSTDTFPNKSQKHTADIEKVIEKYLKVPQEFQKDYDENLIGLTCNSFTNYEGKGWEYTAKYSDGSEHSKHELTDADVLSLINLTSDLSDYENDDGKASKFTTVCKFDDGRLYVERSVEYLAYSAPHSFVLSNGTLTHIAKVTYSRGNTYSGCSLLQVSKNDQFYYRCGAGDGGYSAFEVQRITAGSDPEILLQCEFSAGISVKCTEGKPVEIPSPSPYL